jgi:signal transduction histidine kinase
MRLPRRTVRLRLTFLYGGLFLACGAALLSVTYLLLSRSTRADRIAGVSGEAFRKQPAGGPPADAFPAELQSMTKSSIIRLTQDAAEREQEAVMDQLLVQSGIALALMTVISIGLGWLVAGRILRPLRTITTAAREISATSLHQRLALDSPDDELKELGDTIDELLTRLEASFKAQRQFVANASHELRTPLARQRTVGQVALADPEATVDTLRAAHERILVAGVQQERLIEALLALTRGQAGIDVREPFDLARLTGEVLDSRQAEAKNRNLIIHPKISAAPVAGNPRLTERLIANLVDNALRYNAPDGRIEVATATANGHSTLTVSNTGPEVPRDQLDRLFQPFQRLGTTRTGEGLGLGLSIVEAIATAHDAIVTTRARPEGGLSITVAFPRRQF